MEKFQVTPNTKITRLPKRGVYDKEAIFSIIDEAYYITLAFVRDGKPFMMPTGHCRIGEHINIHGSVGSGYMRYLQSGCDVCLSATLVDGLVLARSAFHHSMNYRSVVIFSKPEIVTDEQEQYLALEAFTEKVQPGRWNEIRKPNPGEWKATMVIKFPINEASAKVRVGGPKDDDEDYVLPVWAGVIPLKIERKPAIADDLLAPEIPLPAYLE